MPSSEITNKPYLHAVGQQGMHILLSTGMCSLGEVEGSFSFGGRGSQQK